MKLGTAIAEIMKREGIEILCGYPVNHLIEHAANADIRPVMVRQERIGLHMADAISRVTSGRRIGAFCMQHGPGAENAMGGVAQCYGESVPVLVLPMGYARRLANIEPNFSSSQAMRTFAKSAEPINIAAEVCNIFRRASTKLKNGRGGPVDVSQTSRDLCRPGRALRQSLAAAEAARRKARHSRHHQPRRQVVVPGDAPAFTRLGRSCGAARGSEIPR